MRTLQILIIVSLLALPIAGYGIWTSSNNSRPEGVVDPISPVADPIDPLAPIDISEVPEVISQRPRSEAIFERFRSIDQLQSQVDFTIKFPESLPRGFTLKGAYESIVLQKYEDHTINEITLIYWDEDVTGDADLEHASENGALFIKILHAPGASVDDFRPPPPPRAIGDVPEPLPPPVAPKLSTISGNPAIIGPRSVEIFVISEETIYSIASSRYTSEQLITILESTIRG